MSKIFLAANLALVIILALIWRMPQQAHALSMNEQATAASHTTPYPFQVPFGFPPPHLPADNPLTQQGVELGQELFFEKKLSGNNTQSCASCHNPQFAFSDHRHPVSVGITGHLGTRHALSLVNLAWSTSFTWDGHITRLRDQVLAPIQNPIEMDQTLAQTVTKLKADPKYPPMFAAAFGDPAITSDRLSLAVEQFLETLVSADSKFDRSLRGEAQLTSQEERGLQLFSEQYDPAHGFFGAGCARCHGGATFTDNGFHNNGLDSTFADQGRGAVTGNPADLGKFKTPSLRNLAATSPYMHDGRFRNLGEVIDHYSFRIVQSATLDPILAQERGGVHLSRSDKAALIAFLGILNDPNFVGPPPPDGPPPSGPPRLDGP